MLLLFLLYRLIIVTKNEWNKELGFLGQRGEEARLRITEGVKFNKEDLMGASICIPICYHYHSQN